MNQRRVHAMPTVIRGVICDAAEAHIGNAGSGADTFFRRKQRRIQVILGGGSQFSEEAEAYPGNAGSGADTFLRGNRGVSR